MNTSLSALWTCILDGVGGIGLARAIWLVLATSALLVLVHTFRTWYSLRHIPGPFVASITNLQRAWWVKTGRAHLYHQAVHEKYGELVRIGPHMVSFSNPSAIPVVYPIRPGFPKVSTPPSYHLLWKAGTLTFEFTDFLERLLCYTTSIHSRIWLDVGCIQHTG